MVNKNKISSNKKFIIILCVIILILALVAVGLLIRNKFSLTGDVISGNAVGITGKVIGMTGDVIGSTTLKSCYTGSGIFRRYQCTSQQICDGGQICVTKVTCDPNNNQCLQGKYGVYCKIYSDKYITNKYICKTECTSNNDDACDNGPFSSDDICNKDLGRCTDCWKGKDETKCKKDQGETCNDKGECVSSDNPPPPPPPPPTPCPQGCLKCEWNGGCLEWDPNEPCKPVCQEDQGCNLGRIPPTCYPAECGVPGKQCFSGLVCKYKICVRCSDTVPCPAGQSCIQDPNPQVPQGFKICSGQTNPNPNCPDGMVWINNQCVFSPARYCKNDLECPIGTICNSVQCIIAKCTYDYDCGSTSRKCVDGICVNTQPPPNPQINCADLKLWDCGAWSECIKEGKSGTQWRKCNEPPLGCSYNNKPKEIQSCTPIKSGTFRCNPGERKCVGNTQYKICLSNRKWQTKSCSDVGGLSCGNGQCLDVFKCIAGSNICNDNTPDNKRDYLSLCLDRKNFKWLIDDCRPNELCKRGVCVKDDICDINKALNADGTHPDCLDNSQKNFYCLNEKCVGCLSDSQCKSSLPACQQTIYQCVTCTNDEFCANNPSPDAGKICDNIANSYLNKCGCREDESSEDCKNGYVCNREIVGIVRDSDGVPEITNYGTMEECKKHTNDCEYTDRLGVCVTPDFVDPAFP